MAGGWWRLRDIVEQQKISAWAVLDLAARNRETVLRNAYLKARRQVERGAKGRPAGYVIPATQHDPLTALKLVQKLLGQGVEVMQAANAFSSSLRHELPGGLLGRASRAAKMESSSTCLAGRVIR